MRFLIISDPHANWHALRAVVADAKGLYDQVVCCGDVVGYNSTPGEVVEWVKANSVAIVRGNHDKVVAGIEDLDWFNDVAQAAARWTMSHLDAEQMHWLKQLPQGPVVCEHFQIWHGSPADEDEYVTSRNSATPRFSDMQRDLAFFGHTHLQGGFFSRYGRVGQIPQVPGNQSEVVLELEPDSVYMINPGSVGQPRDTDPRAAYALYDSERRTVALRRVNYEVLEAAQAIRDAGLPELLGLRLFLGR